MSEPQQHPWASNDFEAFRAHFDRDPFHRMLGITVVERGAGFGRIRLSKTEGTPSGIGGSVHGGVLAAMVDIAMLVAVFPISGRATSRRVRPSWGSPTFDKRRGPRSSPRRP